MNLIVYPGKQSIELHDISIMRYGDPPVDLNFKSTSSLPVEVAIHRGNEVIELNSTTMPVSMTILNTGSAQLRLSQNGNETYGPAPVIIWDIQVFKKELKVLPHDQFRKTHEQNPILTYDVIGFVNDEDASDLNSSFTIRIEPPLSSGSTLFPSTPGEYTLSASGGESSKYFFTYVDGTLTVGNKEVQKLTFDQNLDQIVTSKEPIKLTGYSSDADTNDLTHLGLYYESEDESVARISVTDEDFLLSHWKFNESLYGEAKDEYERNSGKLKNLSITGEDKAWTDGWFGNAIEIDNANGHVDFGPLRLEKDFSFSFWLKPKDGTSESNEMTLLGKMVLRE